MPLLAPAQLGKRRRDKRAFSVPPGRGLAGRTTKPKGSFAVIGTVPKAPKDPLTLLAPAQQGKRRRDKRALSVPPGRRLAGRTTKPKGSFAVIGTVPKAPKDPLTLLAPCQLGKRRRDKRALSVPPGRGLAGHTNKPKRSSDVRGEAPTRRYRARSPIIRSTTAAQ